ncbi:MAG TPA: ATP-binding protein [Planctomycetota bacterium]|nr:ATP-binding protein [Planctomycetota bacterium]
MDGAQVPVIRIPRFGPGRAAESGSFPARDAPSLQGLLPYHASDSDGSLFLLRDGSLGAAWRLEAPETEVLSPDALGQLAARFDDLLRLLPVGSAAQFISRSGSDVRHRTRRWLDAGREPGLAADLASARAAALESFSFILEGAPCAARAVEILFTLRVWPRWPRTGWRDRYAEEKRRLVERMEAIENLLQQAGVAFERLGEAALAENVRVELPRTGTFAVDQGVLFHGASRRRILTAAELPRETWAGMLQRGRPAPLDFAGDGVFVLNVECRDPESVRRFLAAKKRLAFCQMGGGGDGRADLATIKSEVDGVLSEMYVDGARAFTARLHLVIREDASSPAINAFARAGVELIPEEALAGTLYLQTLPLAYDPANDRMLKRGRTLLGLNLAHLLPLYGSFRGTARPDLLLANRRGEPITFSFFDSEVAPHGIVAGVSGSGKSVFANSLVLSTARRGAHVFILDRGNSYRKLCDLLGGTYVAFEPTRPRSINPCGRGLDEGKLLFLTDIVAEMCTQGQREVTVKERSLISRSVRAAFQGPDREVLTSDIRRALEADGDPLARELAIAMEIFCGDGPYAGFFDRPREADFERSPVVFELGEIAKRRDIASVLLMALIHNVTEFCASRLSLEKYLVVDEAWTLLRTATTAQFLEDVLRTYRKLNAAAVMITQQVTDFEGRTGEAIRANAPNRVFLRQTSETVQVMERLLDLSAEEKELLGSLTTLKGRFSEMLILAGAARGVARLIPDPMTYWIATSDPKDNAMLAARIASHRDRGAPDPARSALQELALRMPRGAEGRHE